MRGDDELRTKMIYAIRAYLNKIQSPQRPALETYTLNELKKVCYLYEIDIKKYSGILLILIMI